MIRFSFVKSILIALIGSAVLANSAFAARDDEDFVRVKANEALAILGNTAFDKATNAVRFREFVEEISDVPRVARFVLGKYARGADPEKLNNFTEAFRTYASGIYESRLGDFGGELFIVTGSQDRNPNDSVVSTTVSGGQLQEPVNVYWRIQTRNGKKQVLDVQVFGIWLALHQRNEITAVIANNNGDINAAVDVLKKRNLDADYAAEQAQVPAP